MMGGLFARLRRRPEAEAQAQRGEDAAAKAAAALAEGNAALQRQDFAEAARQYRVAADAQPADAVARLNLGFVLLETGDATGAVDSLEQAIALGQAGDAFLPDAFFLRGRAQRMLGRDDDALASYRAALDRRPDFEEPLAEAIDLLLAGGRAEQAFEIARAAQARTTSPTPWMLAARALHQMQRTEEALATLAALLARHPDHPGALESRGTLLLEVDRAEEALADFQRMEAVHGPSVQGVVNQAVALLELERPQDVVRVTREAAQAHPDHAELQLNRAFAQLTLGDWTEGWNGFDRRWQAWIGKDAPWERWPRWRGEDLSGRTILLVCEQGLGDSLLCLRYVPLVARRAREVVLVLQAPLLPVAQGLAPNCRTIPLGAPVPAVDCQCPLMGLPQVFGTTPGTVPAQVPTPHVDAQRVARWRAVLPEGPGPRVGLVWSGGAKPRHRSVPLAQLAGLAALPCRFVSVQQEVREDDRAAMAAWPGLFDAGPLLHDFGDTAALLQCLDLLVTVDTSVAHLAGALGVPVWNLLRFAPDWRWLLDRGDTPWYPSMRLLRQRALGDWGPVVAQVQRELQSWQAPRQ
ncbi:glycosyltransferase family protein [Ramlibacter sp. USB13]|uniref:Glycosyltransferase family protein n=1 Tax=Ramlibacter cellulosilyticus TaxID=2764187 RepID=A0A923MQ19_9BURK|nr:tetratricopeptide repeat protein [Ramlibacter cellulosilyticus]MBC5782776.1 glycosyltransferase family protein [Ramlibacter cellulosilyticus]